MWVSPLREPLGPWAMPTCAHLLSHPLTPAAMLGPSTTFTVTRIPLRAGPRPGREAGLPSLCLSQPGGRRGRAVCLGVLPACPPSPVGPAAKSIFAVSGEETVVLLRALVGPAGRPAGPS